MINITLIITEILEFKVQFRQTCHLHSGIQRGGIPSDVRMDSCLNAVEIGTVPSVKNEILSYCRVPTRPGKPGKMRVHLENLEKSWNFEKFNKYHGKMI